MVPLFINGLMNLGAFTIFKSSQHAGKKALYSSSASTATATATAALLHPHIIIQLNRQENLPVVLPGRIGKIPTNILQLSETDACDSEFRSKIGRNSQLSSSKRARNM